MSKRSLSMILMLCMVLMLVPTVVFAESNTDLNTKHTLACDEIDKEYTYTGHDLGVTYTPEASTFKVWAPTATEVTLNLYSTGSDEENNAQETGRSSLKKLMDGEKWTGVWTTSVEGNQKGVYYTYTITAKNPRGTKTTIKKIQDIYSVATGVNGNRSMVCDLDSTDPEGWEDDKHVFVGKATDSLVWEVFIKDFSYDSASGISGDNQGKYLAFTETGTTLDNEGKVSTGIDYLKALGVTTVKLNSFYDFGGVDEREPDKNRLLN